MFVPAVWHGVWARAGWRVASSLQVSDTSDPYSAYSVASPVSSSLAVALITRPWRLQTVDTTNIGAPKPLGVTERLTGHRLSRLFTPMLDVRDNLVALAMGDQGVHLIDLQDARRPQRISTTPARGWVAAARLAPGRLLLADDDPLPPPGTPCCPFKTWLRVFDLPEQGAVGLRDDVQLDGTAEDLALVGRFIYFAAGFHGVHVVEMDEAGRLSPVARLNLPGAVRLALSPPHLYVLHQHFTGYRSPVAISALDIRDPGSPREVFRWVEDFETGTFYPPSQLLALGDHIILGGPYNYIRDFDVANGSSLQLRYLTRLWPSTGPSNVGVEYPLATDGARILAVVGRELQFLEPVAVDLPQPSAGPGW